MKVPCSRSGLRCNRCGANNEATLAKIAAFNQSGGAVTVGDLTEVLEGLDAEDDELPMPGDEGGEISSKIKISLADMDLPSWEHELKVDLQVIDALLASTWPTCTPFCCRA